MNYVDNWKKYIPENLNQTVINTIGQARPRDWPPSSAIECAEYSKAKDAGYDLTETHWWVYEKNDLNIDLIFPLNSYHWWITKMYPGQFMPMHTDPHTHEKLCKRYWIPLQDYTPGHILIYKGELVKDYKFGDVFEFNLSTDYHGAANIGHTPRISLLITEYI